MTIHLNGELHKTAGKRNNTRHNLAVSINSLGINLCKSDDTCSLKWNIINAILQAGSISQNSRCLLTNYKLLVTNIHKNLPKWAQLNRYNIFLFMYLY